MLRRNKIADEATLKKRMRISAAVENVDWGLENDEKPDKKAGGGDLVIPFE